MVETMNVKCKEEFCEKLARTKKWGWCQMHETRVRNHDDPNYVRTITVPGKCKIDSCDVVVYNKKHQLCMKHYQRLRLHGNPEYYKQRKSIVPLTIPGGNIVWNYQKAKMITKIVSNIEKMIMCGYIDDSLGFMAEMEKQIGDYKFSKKWFFDKYIEPILGKNELVSSYYPHAKDISKLVDEIIENEYVVNDNEIFTILNLESFGIKNEHGKYSFIDTIDNIIEKKDKLGINLETEEEFEIFYKLKIHYKRWKKLCS